MFSSSGLTSQTQGHHQIFDVSTTFYDFPKFLKKKSYYIWDTSKLENNRTRGSVSLNIAAESERT